MNTTRFKRDSKTLNKIKRLVLQRQYRFTYKAETELLRDHLSEDDVLESIMNTLQIQKIIKSKRYAREKLYIIEAPNLDGLWIYTKGKLLKTWYEHYVFISAKISDL